MRCLHYLWCLLSSPLFIPYTFTINPHIYTPLSLHSCPTLSLLSVVSSLSLLCISYVHSPFSRHPFMLVPLERVPMAPCFPFTHWCNHYSIITFNLQSSLCFHCFIMALATLPTQVSPIVAAAALSELMPVSYLIKRKERMSTCGREWAEKDWAKDIFAQGSVCTVEKDKEKQTIRKKSSISHRVESIGQPASWASSRRHLCF